MVFCFISIIFLFDMTICFL